jgi:hypothetical protein
MTKESRLDYRYSPDEIGELNAVLDGQRTEIERLKAERTYIAETLYGELYADNARLLAALRRIADDGKNCADHCRRQARRELRRLRYCPRRAKAMIVQEPSPNGGDR